MSTPNAELAYKVLDTATANHEHLNMGSWGWSVNGSPVRLDDLTGPDCGTVACLAGWTVAMAGYGVDSSGMVYDAKGDMVHVWVDALAAELLGITGDQRDRLFYAHEAEIHSRIAEIFGPRPAVTA